MVMSDDLISLQTKVAHQELAIEELQKALFEQQSTIERLEKTMKVFKLRFEAVINGEGEIGPANERPPHY